jgi:hypothetical protein
VSRLPGFHTPRDYLDLARSREASPDQFHALASSEYDFVLEAVATNPSTPPDVLAQLVPKMISTWNDSALLLLLIRNDNTPTEVLGAVPGLVLSRLEARDDQRSFEAGVALARRPDTPEEVLTALVSDERATTEFRQAVARETTHQRLRARLLLDSSEQVRLAAGREPFLGAGTERVPWALAEAFELIAADIKSSGVPAPEIGGEDWAHEPGRAAAVISWDHGGGRGVAVWAESPLVDKVVLLADQVQDEMVERLWQLGRPATWPECPEHPGTHPLTALRIDDRAMWACPRTGRPIAPIGGLRDA